MTSLSPKAFFVQRSEEEADREWNNLMNESFLLKTHGKLSLQEQAIMTAEERKWWLKALERHFEKQERGSGNSAAQTGKVDHTPGKTPTKPSTG